MVVAVGIKVRHTILVVDGGEYALLVLSAYLSPRGRRGLDRRRGIGGYGGGSATTEGQFVVGQKALLKYLETPDPGSRSVPFLLKDSSLSCGLRRSILVGLRGRGEWYSVSPLWWFVSTEVDSAIMGKGFCA